MDNNVKLAAAGVGIVVAGAAGVCALGLGARALYRKMPNRQIMRQDVKATFDAMKESVSNSRPVQFAGRQITAAKTQMVEAKNKVVSEMQSAARFVNSVVQEIIRPTLNKVAGLYGLSAGGATVGFTALALKATTVATAIPPVGAAFIALGVTFSIYNLYVTAREEREPLEFFSRHIKPTINRSAAFFATTVTVGTILVVGALLSRGHGDIIINRGTLF